MGDNYIGGDLVMGMRQQVDDQGQINCHDLAHVVSQMCASIQYLHRSFVVHRDVKPDNFLIDRKDITNKTCKVVLADFGTACTFGDGERLREKVGTTMFWAPEMFDRNY